MLGKAAVAYGHEVYEVVVAVDSGSDH